jgi:uncharacterized protein with PhoU and TrkA domain
LPRITGASSYALGLNFRLLAIVRGGELSEEDAASDEVVRAGDLLLVQGREEDLDVLQVEHLEDDTPYLSVFD